jgi:hypothetical protein
MPVGRKKMRKNNKLEHFPSKWMPVGRKKMRKNNKLQRTT